ncbi:MAG: tyrosine-type recombinase/integrase [Sulfuricurvum sp.]|nr:tyrosine-type recombinase/integrase [Sulfuricurvum sp.]
MILLGLNNGFITNNRFVDTIVRKIQSRGIVEPMGLFDEKTLKSVDATPDMEKFFVENYDEITEDYEPFYEEDHPEVFQIMELYRKLEDYEKAKLKDMMEYWDVPTKIVKLDLNNPEHMVIANSTEDYNIASDSKNYYATNILDETALLLEHEKKFREKSIEQAFNEWVQWKMDSNVVSDKTLRYYQSSFNYLKIFFRPDRKVSDFTIRDFKNILLNFPLLPANIVKHERFVNMDLRSIIEITRNENLPRLSNKTINNHMINYKNMFQFFVEEKEYIADNPVKVRLLKEGESEKIPFEHKDLALLFENIKDKDVKDIILIALHSGMRLGEIVNMKKEHIYDNLFHIYDGKTKNATRVIHIHSKIKDIVEWYIKHNTGEYLIYDGNVDAIQKRINRRIQPIIKDKNKTFHSTRKNFIRELITDPERKLEWIQMIVGHSVSEGTKLTKQTYGREMRVPQKILEEYVESVHYIF